MSDAPIGNADHTPVLLTQVLEGLALEAGDTVVDATAGRGGHAQAIAQAIGARGTIVLLDRDRKNLDFATGRVLAMPNAPRVIAEHANFVQVGDVLRARSLRADGFLADLGFSSNQMGDSNRGFSFSVEGPLDMRLDQTGGETAQALLARISEQDLADLIFQLGEDPFSRRIARRIVAIRDLGLLKTTLDLAKAVVEAYGGKARHSRMHPATRTFMALRIAVNQELESLETLLRVIEQEIASFSPKAAGPPDEKSTPNGAGEGRFGKAPASMGGFEASSRWLSPNARVAFLAFHSLEDRLMKRVFVDWERQGWATRIKRKPLVASEAECEANPRARSAKLRVVRIGGI